MTDDKGAVRLMTEYLAGLREVLGDGAQGFERAGVAMLAFAAALAVVSMVASDGPRVGEAWRCHLRESTPPKQALASLSAICALPRVPVAQ